MSEALIALAVALSACVQATAGMGFALVLSPVLLVVLAPTSAIALMTWLGLGLNLLVLFHREGRPNVDWVEVRPMLIAAVPGSICGLLVLRSLPKPWLETAVGLVVIGLTLARLRPRSSRTRDRTEHVPAARLGLGLLAGALSTAIAINGPPLAIWLGARRLAFPVIRDSLAALFLGMGVITALTLIPTLGDVHLRAIVIGCCVLGVVAGHALGSRLHPRIRPERLQQMLSLIILASGASALIIGLSSI